MKREKQKYNSFLENLENDVESQIKDVESSVKKELNEKHQRELDKLRKQMEARMTELQESMVRFNEESARKSAAAATITASATRRGSVIPSEMKEMKSQVEELTAQSSSLREELAMAQSALNSYQRQVDDLLAVQSQQMAMAAERSNDSAMNSGVGTISHSRSEHQFANTNEGMKDEASSNSRVSSSRNDTDNNRNNSFVNQSGGGWFLIEIILLTVLCFICFLIFALDDSGVGGGWNDRRAQLKAAKSLTSLNQVGNERQTEHEGTITPPEFTDPNNLPEHVQFKLERFQQSLMSAESEYGPESLLHGRGRNSMRKSSLNENSRKESTTSSKKTLDGTNHGYQKNPKPPPKSRGAVLISRSSSQQQMSRGLSGSLKSLGDIQSSNADLRERNPGRPSNSSLDDEMKLGRRASTITASTTVFARNEMDQKRPADVYSMGETVSTVAVEPERVFRVVLAGDSAVGKSSILMRLVENRFVGQLPTVRFNFHYFFNFLIFFNNFKFPIDPWR